MMKRIFIGLGGLLIVFLSYVASRPGKFHYERSGLIKAPAEKIFPFLSQLKLGGEWSPYEKKDPNMQKSFSGMDGAAGAKMIFSGNQEVGAGEIQLVRIEPLSLVELRLLMTKPMSVDHRIVYRLTPEADATRFSWSMEGEGGFMMKLMSVFIDCEKMITDDFVKGIENLKQRVEQGSPKV